MDKVFTIDKFIEFCKTQGDTSFNAKDAGYSIHVLVPVTFSKEETTDNEAAKGLMKLKFLIAHTNLNANGSNVSKDSADKALASFANRPILAYIHQLDDGTYDFYEHNVTKITNDDGTVEEKYLETQVGSLTNDAPWYEHDDANDWENIYCYGVIPREYSKAAEIIEQKNGQTIVSAELGINAFSWNANQGFLDLTDWYMSGVTLLGKDDEGNVIEPGMEGANATMADFAQAKNSLFSNFQINQAVINAIVAGVVTGVNNKLNNSRKEDNDNVNKFEELLKKYNKTADDVKFEHDGLSDEELEAKFAEAFAEHTEPATDPEPATPQADEPKTFSLSVSDGENSKALFSYDSNDIRAKLGDLIAAKFNDETHAYSVALYPETHEAVFELYNWHTDFEKTMRYTYAVDDAGVYSLTNDGVEVHRVYVTDEEDKAIDDMKTNFSKVQSELADYKKKEDDAKKQSILSATKYAYIADTDEMKTINDDEHKEEFDKMTSGELETKLNGILLKYASEGKLKVNNNDNASNVKKNSGKKILPFSNAPENNRFGGIFDN